MEFYGGRSNDHEYFDDSLAEIPFQFNLNTKEYRNSYSYPPGIDKTRILEKIVVTDTLPIYVNKEGETVSANFDPGKNPGWTLNPDGKLFLTS